MLVLKVLWGRVVFLQHAGRACASLYRGARPAGAGGTPPSLDRLRVSGAMTIRLRRSRSPIVTGWSTGEAERSGMIVSFRISAGRGRGTVERDQRSALAADAS